MGRPRKNVQNTQEQTQSNKQLTIAGINIPNCKFVQDLISVSHVIAESILFELNVAKVKTINQWYEQSLLVLKLRYEKVQEKDVNKLFELEKRLQQTTEKCIFIDNYYAEQFGERLPKLFTV